jgi:Flp pilus assembly protein TadG
MKSAGSVNKFLRDSDGASLVEFTIVFPIFILAALGTVDITYMLFDWSMANKAAFIGARTAIVSDPVASGITNLTYSTAGTQTGQPCFDPATGDANLTSGCPTVNTVCTPAASNGSCTGGYNWDTTSETAYTTILANMQWSFHVSSDRTCWSPIKRPA